MGIHDQLSGEIVNEARAAEETLFANTFLECQIWYVTQFSQLYLLMFSCPQFHGSGRKRHGEDGDM